VLNHPIQVKFGKILEVLTVRDHASHTTFVSEIHERLRHLNVHKLAQSPIDCTHFSGEYHDCGHLTQGFS
jgi:hypothetical protein